MKCAHNLHTLFTGCCFSLLPPVTSFVYSKGSQHFLSLNILCSQLTRFNFTGMQVSFRQEQHQTVVLCCPTSFKSSGSGVHVPTIIPKHAFQRFPSKSVSHIRKTTLLCNRERTAKQNNKLFQMGTIVTHLMFFWIWFNSLKPLLYKGIKPISRFDTLVCKLSVHQDLYLV